jgi:hypothetical protein
MPKWLLALLGTIVFLASSVLDTAEAQVKTGNEAARQIVDLHLPDNAFQDAIAPTLQRIRDDIQASEQMRVLEKEFPGARKTRADAAVAATGDIYKKKLDQAVDDIVVELADQFSDDELNQAFEFYQKPHVARFLVFLRTISSCSKGSEAECERQGAMEATEYFSEAPKQDKDDWAKFLSSDAGKVDAFLENLLGMVFDRFAKMPVTPAESEALDKLDRDTLRKIQS